MGTVRAAVLTEIGTAPVVEEIALVPPGPGQLRVRLAATGVCHSDLSLANGTLPQVTPCVLGHEGAGRVVELGQGVTDLAVGDPVVLNWAPPCRACWFCEHGEPYLCENATRAWGHAYATRSDGSDVFPGLGTAGFAEETVIGADACLKLPDDIPLRDAALLGCAVLTGVGAVLNAARVAPGDSVVVFGLGGVGLSAVQGARIARAGQIIAVDPAPEKADLARRLGATEVLEPGPDLAKRIRARTGGRGADHAFECVGRAETMRTAWNSTRRGGQTTVLGMGRKTDELTFNALEVGHFARTLRGCFFGSTDPAVDIPFLLECYRDGRLDLAAMVTAEIGLDEVGGAFDKLTAGAGARSVILFE